MHLISLPPTTSSDVIITFFFENGADYEPRGVKEDHRRYTPNLPTEGPEGELLTFDDGESRIERVDVREVIEHLLRGAHVSHAITRTAHKTVGEFSKEVRRTFFDIVPRWTMNDAERALGDELLRFAGRSLWTVEVYRNPRADLPGKTGYHIRCRGRLPFRDAAGSAILINAKDGSGDKVPMEPNFVLGPPSNLRPAASATTPHVATEASACA